MNTLIVEPICRGSRLDNLSLVLDACEAAGSDAVLITRADYYSEHYEEMIDHELNVLTFDSDLDGAWIRSLTRSEMGLILELVQEFDKTSISPYRLVFTALDDYLRAIFLSLVPKLSHLEQVYFVKYRVSYLLDKTTLRERALDWLTRSVIQRWRAKLISFDERLKGVSVTGREVVSLVDPWIGYFDGNLKKEARESYSISTESWVISNIGKQVPRKGFALVLKALPVLFEKIPALHYCQFGAVGSEFQEKWDEVCIEFDGKITYIDEFLPQSEMSNVYAIGDTTLLPYTKEHTATSGVLPRSIASGVPVVASSHGAIGYIVENYGLGEVFESTDVEGFIDACLSVYSKKNYSLKAYSEISSPDSVVNKLSKEFKRE